ncbi:MAG: ribosome-associated toxin RatA of RatAB toxin-antitoxin module [Alphaproteobacteria bacterium]|jgi:ribosome-associated toxin RatA of RatAB toxin-antitoxin module
MPNINKNALVAYSASQMFKLVNDVQSYQHFLPGCRYSEVLSVSEHHMEAKMILVKAGIEQELVTRNTLIAGRSIQMSLAQGPFEALSGGWTFTPLSDEACKIELSLDFTFSSTLVDMAFGKVFRSVTSNMVKAFTKRAKEVYR